MARAVKREDADGAAETYPSMMERIAGQVVQLFRSRRLLDGDAEPQPA